MLQGQYTSWCTLVEQFVSEVHTMRPSNLFVPASWSTNSDQLNFMHGDRTERFYINGRATHCHCHCHCQMFPSGGTPRFWPKKSLSQSSPSVMCFFLSRTVRFSLFQLFSLSNPFKPKEPSTSYSSYLCDVINLNVTRLILDKQIVELVFLDIDGVLT